MKKCKQCGALQNDDRTVCLDCGSLLGRPLSEEEEAAQEAALDDRLEDLAERTDDFYVPLRDKILGVLSILCLVASFALLLLTAEAKEAINQSIPDNVMVSTGGGFTTIMSDGTGDYVYPSRRVHELNNVSMAAITAFFCSLVSAPMLLFPRFMWFIDTLKYRMFYEWDTTPSDFALITRKLVSYVLFVIGTGCLLYGYYLYL